MGRCQGPFRLRVPSCIQHDSEILDEDPAAMIVSVAFFAPATPPDAGGVNRLSADSKHIQWSDCLAANILITPLPIGGVGSIAAS
jgi:hypothetical protein